MATCVQMYHIMLKPAIEDRAVGEEENEQRNANEEIDDLRMRENEDSAVKRKQLIFDDK